MQKENAFLSISSHEFDMLGEMPPDTLVIVVFIIACTLVAISYIRRKPNGRK